MISKQRQLFYFVGDTPYKSLADAQKADLMALLPLKFFATLGDQPFERLADWMLENSTAIVDTLTTTPTSRLKGRKLHGGTRKPKSKPKFTPANLQS